MAQNNVKKMILKYGYDKHYTGSSMRLVSASAVCTACGKPIKSDDDLADVHYSLTKRKTCLFWHGKCADKIWSSNIKAAER